MESYYRILDVPVSASFRQIKKAFRKAAAKYHPDSNNGYGNPQLFSRVVEAYRHLEKRFAKRHKIPVEVKKETLEPIVTQPHRPPASKTTKSYSPFSETKEYKPRQKRRQNYHPKPIYQTIPKPASKPQPLPIPIDSLFSNLSLPELEKKMDRSTSETEKGDFARILVRRFRWLALPALNRALLNASPQLKQDILDCMAELGDWASINTIGDYLHDSDYRVACHALGLLKGITKVPAGILIGELEDDGKSIKRLPSIIKALIEYRDRLQRGDFALSDLFIALAIGKNTDAPLPLILNRLFYSELIKLSTFDRRPALETIY